MVEANEVDEVFLGILLNTAEAIYAVNGKVLPNMLEGEPNQLIYRCMVKLAASGTDIARVLVKNELIKDGVFNASGGDGYLDYLMLKGNTTSDIAALADAVIENYRRRELTRFSVHLQKISNQDASTTISRASQFLNKLSALGGNTEDVVLLGDAVEDTFSSVKERVKNPGMQGITTGFSKVDKITSGFRPGEMWFIGARPSMGKTSLLLRSLLASAKSGAPCLLINREMYLSNLNERLLSMESKIPYYKIRDGFLSAQEIELLATIKSAFKSLPLYIDNNWGGKPDYIFSLVRKYHQLRGIKIVGIDYIQLLVERSDDNLHELGRFSRGLKLLAGELGVTPVILSQLNRKLEDRPDKRPMMYDLRQAGYLEEDGDYMIGLYRDEIYKSNSPDAGKVEFIIRKARNAALETVMLGFDGPTISVYDLDNLPKLK
jgi:replicative DNA helicase